MTLSGAETLYVTGQSNGFAPAAESLQTTTQDIANLCLVQERLSLTTPNGKIIAATDIDSFTVWQNSNIAYVYAELRVAGSVSPVIIDINVGGVSILSSLIYLDAGALKSTQSVIQPVIMSPSVTAGSVINVDVDSADGGTTAAGLKITIVRYLT